MVFRIAGWIVTGALVVSCWGCKPRELPLKPPSMDLGPAKPAAPEQKAAAPAPRPRPQDVALWTPPPASAQAADDTTDHDTTDHDTTGDDTTADAKPADATPADKAAADSQSADAKTGGEKPAVAPPAAPRVSNQPKEEPPRYTWAEMEELLAKLREKGKTDPIARQTLSSWYNRLSRPAFTEAKDFAQHLENLKLWQEELPDSTTPLVVMGSAYIDYAWEARGDGVALTVTEEGWKLFHERIAKAHELLDEAIRRGVPDGQAYARMLTVAKAEGMPKEETRAILAAGNQVDPTYMFMYVHMSDYLLPKWHGEPGDVAKFVKEVVEMVPGDDGLEAVAWIIGNCHCSDRTILYWGGIESKTLSGAARVFFERFPESHWVANYAALLAMAGNDHELGLQVLNAFTKYRHPVDGKAWGNNQGFLQFEKWCRAPVHPTSEQYRLKGSLGQVRTLAWSGNPRYVWLATYEGFTPILLADTHTGEAIQPMRLRGVLAYKLAFEPNQRLLAAAATAQGLKAVLVWNIVAPDEPFPIPLEDICNAVAISPVSPLVAAHDGTKVHLVDVENRAINHTLTLPDKYVNAIVFSSDGSLLATYAQEEVAVWEVETGKKKYAWPADHADPQPEVRMGMPYHFDDQQRLVADYFVPKQGKGGIGRFSEGELEPEILLSDASGGFDALSPDGKYFAVAEHKSGRREVTLWDVAKKSIVRRFEGHAIPIYHIAFSPDGKLLATGSEDGELKIWNVEPAKNPQESPPPTP